MKKTWTWLWIGGGYNSAEAATREEALALATRMGLPLRPGYATLRPDPATLRESSYEDLVRLDREYGFLVD